MGFEDISPLSHPTNDRDYNDHQFVFTNVGQTRNVPEGGSTLPLMGLATLGVAILRRRFNK